MDTPTTYHQPTHISLCTGYGGIDLGLKRVFPDLRTVAYAEIESSAIELLLARMEGGSLDPAPIWSNLRTFPWSAFSDRVDLLSGGYPCQPFSSAGKRLGADDPRHLWPAIADGIRVLRPQTVFFENVEGHITLGLSSVLSDLEELGYEPTWGVFSASEVGAPHQRKRVFIMAHNLNRGCLPSWISGSVAGVRAGGAHDSGAVAKPSPQLAHRNGERLEGYLSELAHQTGWQESVRSVAGCSRSSREGGVADTDYRGSGEDWESSQSRATGTEQPSSIEGRVCAGEVAEEQVWPSRPGDVGDTEDGDGTKSCVLLRPGQGKSGGAGGCGRAWSVWPSRPGEPQHWWEPPRVVADAKSRRQPCNQAPPEEDRWRSAESGMADGETATLANTGRNAGERRSAVGEVQAGDDGEAGACEAGSARGEDEAGEWKESEPLRSSAEPAVGDTEDMENAIGSRGEEPAVLNADLPTEPSRGDGEDVGDTSDEGQPQWGCGQMGKPGAQSEPQRPDCHGYETKRKAESEVGGGADGIADWMDYAELCYASDNRTDELRMLGNGVVPATAARAFAVLAADLAAGCPGRPERPVVA